MSTMQKGHILPGIAINHFDKWLYIRHARLYWWPWRQVSGTQTYRTATIDDRSKVDGSWSSPSLIHSYDFAKHHIGDKVYDIEMSTLGLHSTYSSRPNFTLTALFRNAINGSLSLFN